MNIYDNLIKLWTGGGNENSENIYTHIWNMEYQKSKIKFQYNINMQTVVAYVALEALQVS